MAENKKEIIKMCPLCKKQYPQEDNYCDSDGTKLETVDLSEAQATNRP
jgi:hypothetical protein